MFSKVLKSFKYRNEIDYIVTHLNNYAGGWIDAKIEYIHIISKQLANSNNSIRPIVVNSSQKASSIKYIKLLQYVSYVYFMNSLEYVNKKDGKDFSSMLGLVYFEDDYNWALANLSRYMNIFDDELSLARTFLEDVLSELISSNDSEIYYISLLEFNKYSETELVQLGSFISVASAFNDSQKVREIKQTLEKINNHNEKLRTDTT